MSLGGRAALLAGCLAWTAAGERGLAQTSRPQAPTSRPTSQPLTRPSSPLTPRPASRPKSPGLPRHPARPASAVHDRAAPAPFARRIPDTWGEWWDSQREFELAVRRRARERRGAEGASVGIGEFFVAAVSDPTDRSAETPAAVDFAATVAPLVRRVLWEETAMRAPGDAASARARAELRAACVSALACANTGLEIGLTVSQLRALLDDPSALVRTAVFDALTSMRDPAAGVLLESFIAPRGPDAVGFDGHDRARALAALAARAIRGDLKARDAAFERLVPFCLDADPAVARAAIGGIARMCAAVAEPSALERRAADRAVGALSTMLGDERARDSGVIADLAAALATILAERSAADSVRAFASAVVTRELQRSTSVEEATRVALSTALGALLTPADDDGSERLRQVARDAGDSPEAHAALIALGRIGGETNRGFLANEVRRGSKIQRVPWASLGLGIAIGRSRAQAATTSPPRSSDRDDSSGLREALAATRRADASGAIVLALGLALDATTIGADNGALTAALRRGNLTAWNFEALALLLAQSDERSQFQFKARLERIRAEPLDSEHVLAAAIGAIGELPLDAKLAPSLLELLQLPSVGTGPLELAARLGRAIGARRYVALVEPLAVCAGDADQPIRRRVAAFLALGELFADPNDPVRSARAAWRRFALPVSPSETPFGTD